jgi:hypothetical protein
MVESGALRHGAAFVATVAGERDKHYPGRLIILAQAPGNFVAVDPWQADVDERKLDSTREGEGHACQPIVCDLHVVITKFARQQVQIFEGDLGRRGRLRSRRGAPAGVKAD